MTAFQPHPVNISIPQAGGTRAQASFEYQRLTDHWSWDSMSFVKSPISIPQGLSGQGYTFLAESFETLTENLRKSGGR